VKNLQTPLNFEIIAGIELDEADMANVALVVIDFYKN
jgi:hypothetical protein